MMTRRWVLLVVALVFGLAADAGAEPRTPKAPAQKTQKASPPSRAPLQIYLAKGGADACGRACNEWIAIEGYFDRAAIGRVQAFLRRHGARKRPVYFHSPGGSGIAAMAIGRELRARGLVTGAGKTIPRACASADHGSEACRAAKRSSQVVEADWRPDATCSSACVYALLGGAERWVPPSARLGVHAGRFRLTLIRKHADGRVERLTEKHVPSLQKVRAAEFDAQLRRYIRDMGIDGTLFDTAVKVPHESIHYLSRNQIAAFGIDRREFMETPWITVTSTKGSLFVSKWMVEALGDDRKDYRASSILLSCAGPQRAELRYWRSVNGNGGTKPATFAITIGARTVVLIETGTIAKSDVFETGGALAGSRSSVEFDMLEAAAAGNSISVKESDPWNSATPSRLFKMSTQGLAEHVKLLRDKCATPAG